PGWFAVGRLKALTPMQMATSLRIATSDPQAFESGKPEEFEKRIECLESAARGFAGSFAQPTDDSQIGVSEALLFSNGDKIAREYLADGNDRLLTRVKPAKAPDKATNLAVRAALCRRPPPEWQQATRQETEAS